MIRAPHVEVRPPPCRKLTFEFTAMTETTAAPKDRFTVDLATKRVNEY